MGRRFRQSKAARKGSGVAATTLVVDPDAWRDIEDHCAGSPEREVCGVLVGFTWREQDGSTRSRVVSVIKGVHAREEQMSVTFTHETWQAVHETLERRTDKARVVGWYHSHPDFGVFFSSHDLFVHRNFFGSDGQIGIVVDPVRRHRGAFVTTRSGVEPLRRFEIARQNAAGHLVACTYAADAVQQDAPEAMAAARQDPGAQGQLDAIEATMARMERTLRLVKAMSVIACAVAVVLLALALLDRLLPPRTMVMVEPRAVRAAQAPAMPQPPAVQTAPATMPSASGVPTTAPAQERPSP